MKKLYSTALAATFLASSLAVSVPVYAAGGGSETSTPSCRKGKVWDKKTKKCVKISSFRDLSPNDDAVYAVGRDLAYRERYDEAISVLTLASNRSDPRILNFLGYSHRKQGRIDVGLGYYKEALKADPDYTLVREYMGEAFLQLGQVDKAKEQLVEIEKRCGVSCEEYAMLAEHIAAFK